MKNNKSAKCRIEKTTANINWFGPYLLDRIYYYEIAYEKGFYSISRVWGGKESLLYIGKTKRMLIERIFEHDNWIYKTRGKIKVRFGILELYRGQKFSDKRLKDMEALLIAYHNPPFNVQNHYYYYGRCPLTIINKGRRGPIEGRVSTDEMDWV